MRARQYKFQPEGGSEKSQLRDIGSLRIFPRWPSTNLQFPSKKTRCISDLKRKHTSQIKMAPSKDRVGRSIVNARSYLYCFLPGRLSCKTRRNFSGAKRLLTPNAPIFAPGFIGRGNHTRSFFPSKRQAGRYPIISRREVANIEFFLANITLY